MNIIDRDIYLLSNRKYYQIISLPIINFILLSNKISFNNIDTILFTSQNSLNLLNKIDNSWIKYKIISIGENTTKYIEKYSKNIIYSNSESYGKNLAKYIIHNFYKNKILYIRPKIVAFDFKKYFQKFNFDIEEKILYETKCIRYRGNKKPKKNSIIIFTSPSTVKCFINNFEWDKSFIAIAIGETTAKHIPLYIKYFLSDIPSIKGCIDKVSKL